MVENEARKYFPLMPREVFDMWLLPDIKDHGWPFSGEQELDPNSPWAKRLRDRPPYFWRRVSWKRMTLPFGEIRLEGQAVRNTQFLSNKWLHFLKTGERVHTFVKGTHERLAALASVVSAEKRFPAPLVCLSLNEEWLLLDGTHRVAVLLTLPEQQTFQCDCWVGTHAL